MTEQKERLKTQALLTHDLCLVYKTHSSTPDEDRGSKALVFLIVLYVSLYRWVHFSRAVLFCQPHQQVVHSFLGSKHRQMFQLDKSTDRCLIRYIDQWIARQMLGESKRKHLKQRVHNLFCFLRPVSQNGCNRAIKQRQRESRYYKQHRWEIFEYKKNRGHFFLWY